MFNLIEICLGDRLLEIFSLISIELEIDLEYIFPIQLIARLSYLGFVVFPVCSQDGTNLLPKMATNIVIFMQINKCLIMHLGRTIFCLVVTSSHILWEMFSSLQSCQPPWERATGRQKGKECLQKKEKFIEASVVTVRIEGHDIDSDTIHVMESFLTTSCILY